MANRCGGGPECPYGYNHTHEHSEAAKLGWERRRHGAAKYVESSFGNKFKLHMHPGTRGSYQHFILEDIEDPTSRFELTRAEFYQLAREVRQAERSRVEQKNLFDKQNNARLRAEAAQARKDEKARQIEMREAERAQRRLEREQEQDRRRFARFEADSLRDAIREYVPGGIKPYKGGHELEEYQAVPRSLRAKQSDRFALTLDDAALQLRESAPWLNITTADELTQAFNRVALQRRNEQYRRRYAS